MGITAEYGPFITFGVSQQPPNDSNSDLGPNAWYGGDMLLDPRTAFTYQPGQRSGQPNYGWYSTTCLTLIDQVPSTIATANIAALQVPVAGTPMTLVAASGAGITVACQVTNGATGVLVTGLHGIDVNSAANPLAPVIFGTGPDGNGGSMRAWNPAFMVSRAVSLTSVGNDTGATFTVRGYDIYGMPMTETITGAGVGLTVTGKKAFKFVTSVTPAGALSGSNVSVGTSDVIGLPLRMDRVSQLLMWYGNPQAFITTAPTVVAAVTTSPATALTGDVRGTLTLPSASDGAKRLTLSWSPIVANMASVAGLVGVTQF